MIIKKTLCTLPLRDSSASFRGRSPGFTPAGEPRMSGRAFLLPERPEEAKSNTGSTSVISGPLYDKNRDSVMLNCCVPLITTRKNEYSVVILVGFDNVSILLGSPSGQNVWKVESTPLVIHNAQRGVVVKHLNHSRW